ncbi:dihydrofolate reductase [Nocardioides sp. B-3]|uniref:dihydrofolate reductase n=1 Tax=Nocardioides sp. B-3 TaxID=2895565 RepID=UPI002153448C|nr:dihydrofolate reductase [Nocardioides sp. B-3]UUZ58733.1 dihydrofolate reductase [Nocardioides sp. B-3]
MPSEAGRRLTLVAAYADGRVIGDDGSIPWHISEDFAHFKAVTMGGVLLMGRATRDSIGRPLPGRTTIVLTRSTTRSAEGALVAHSLDVAPALAATLDGETFVVGGAQIYELALPLATHRSSPRSHCRPRVTRAIPSSRSTSGPRSAASTAPTSASTGCGGSVIRPEPEDSGTRRSLGGCRGFAAATVESGAGRGPAAGVSRSLGLRGGVG